MEKLSRRHRMMAAGASGATRRSVVDPAPTRGSSRGQGSMMVGTSSMSSVPAEQLPDDIGTHEYKPVAIATIAEEAPGECSASGTEGPRTEASPTKTYLSSETWASEVTTNRQEGHALVATEAREASAADAPAKSFWQQQVSGLQEIFFQWLNLLLIFVPLGQFVEYSEWSTLWIFGCNFLAIIPLASILGSATEAISGHTGQLLGGLLNATFGNAVEMIVCVQAVKVGLIRVVQGNLLGSILSNLLLVLGMAICASGVLRKSQAFNAHGAAANMTCQAVASISVCLPTMFRSVANTTEEELLVLSRVCSLLLMGVYGLFLFFQMKTHSDLFADVEDEEPEEASLSLTISVLLLLICTLVVACCSEALVSSIEGVSEDYGLPKAFIGVILLPIVGNAAEHATAVTCAYKGMMDLALGVAVGSSTQIALFVVPCSVICGWFFDQPMTLGFRKFDTACQMLSVALVSQVLQHGNTNWLHGSMLMTTYLLIACITWFIPE